MKVVRWKLIRAGTQTKLAKKDVMSWLKRM